MSHRFKKLCTAFLFVLSINTVFFGVTPQPARALGEAKECSEIFGSISINGRQISTGIPMIDIPTDSLNITLTSAIPTQDTYVIKLWSGFVPETGTPKAVSAPATINQGMSDTLTLDLSSLSLPATQADSHLKSMDLKLYSVITGKELCQIADINAVAKIPMCDGIQILQSRLVAQPGASPELKDCRFNVGISNSNSSCVEEDPTETKPIIVTVKGLRKINGDPLASGSKAQLTVGTKSLEAEIVGGTAVFPPLTLIENGTYKLVITHNGFDALGGCKDKFIGVENGCLPDQCSTTNVPITPIAPGSITPSDPFELCKQASKSIPSNTPGLSQFAECEKCVVDPENVKGVWTAVGCIKTEPQAILQSVVKIGIGLGGGIALLMTLIGGFLLTTSQGDPKRTQEGKDMITSSVIGIVFVLFSVVILQFIGVTVLRLPGFGGA